MGVLQRLFENHIETKDQHSDPRLRTHYFKATKPKLLEACRQWIEKESFLTLLDQSDERGEIAAQVKGRRKGLLVLTVISTSPFRTAVDVSFTVDRGLNLGFGQALCEKLYTALRKTYEEVDQR